MIFYYVIIEFYSDLSTAKEDDEIAIPFHTYEEALAYMTKITETYEGDSEYHHVFWFPDITHTAAYITIVDNKVIRAFRLEIMQGQLDMFKLSDEEED